MTQNFKTLTVDLGERSYPIHIGDGLLEQAVDLIPLDLTDRTVFILSDRSVEPHVKRLVQGLKGHVGSIHELSIEGGEQAKSYECLQDVLNWMLDHKVDRKSVFFAFGGGVIGDLGGFAASIVLRGIPYVQVPTTLLAQVDSSVGGKTGINTGHGKNLVGSFYQPEAVFCDLGTLHTLPEREIRAGYAEIAKYGLIDRPDFFEWLEQNGQRVTALEPEAVMHAVETSCASKAAIVAEDELEAGRRALLNLGHTFGHALEAAAQYDGRLLHGEGVAIGVVCAYELSAKMGLCSQEDPGRVASHLQAIGLPTKISDIDPSISQTSEDLAALMLHDKKATAGKITFVLTKGIGQAFLSADVHMNDVMNVIEESASRPIKSEMP